MARGTLSGCRAAAAVAAVGVAPKCRPERDRPACATRRQRSAGGRRIAGKRMSGQGVSAEVPAAHLLGPGLAAPGGRRIISRQGDFVDLTGVPPTEVAVPPTEV